MAKHGQAKVLSNDEFDALLQEIEKHRHPEKNALIMQLSFKLGLRVQEIALLRIREVAELGSHYPAGYHIKDVLVLPKSFTKGARALAATRHRATERTSVRFTIAEFVRLINRIAKSAQTGQPIVPTDY